MASPKREEEQAPRHLIPLPGSSFGVWPWACVRGAGFPVQGVLALAAPETASLIERAVDDEGSVPFARMSAARREEIERSFKAESIRISERLRALAASPRLREAVTWQNRHALRTGLDNLAGKPAEGGNKKVRQKERLLASYLQRYCVKNDTIGFFGPVGWARVRAGGRALVVRPGPSLLEKREVYFEHWCIDALVQKLAEDAELRAFAPPRFLPYFRFTDNTLHVPFMGPVELSLAQVTTLKRCDGTKGARQIAREIAAMPELGLDEAAVFAFLEQARGMGVIAWDFGVSLQLYPERALRRALERIDDEALRARALAPLDELEALRARVAKAAGDAEALDKAMEELEAAFQRITGNKPTRSEGQVYAARTLIYEDGRRGAEVEIGAPLLDKLGGPLSLLLTSARWVTHQIASRYRERLVALHDKLAPPDGQPLDLITCHKAFVESEPSLVDRGASISPAVEEVQRELQARWGEILNLPARARRVEYRSADLRPEVLARFAAPSAGWEMARYVAPDVMIEAKSLEAIDRGDYRLVLGEVHLSNTLATSIFVAQHPALEELERLIERDLPDPQVIPVLPKADWSQRTNHVLLSSFDYRYAFSPDPPPSSPEQTLRVADLVVVKREGKIEVQSRDGGFRQDMIEFMGLLLTMMSLNALHIVPDRDHLPRITIDDVIIGRETWSFVAGDLAFAKADDPLARWVEAKRWQKGEGLPRFLFLKAPVEKKPCFVDLDSPVYVETLAKLARQTAESGPGKKIRLTEMVPDFEHVFFPDAEGQRYTSELRMVLLDGRRCQAPGATERD